MNTVSGTERTVFQGDLSVSQAVHKKPVVFE